MCLHPGDLRYQDNGSIAEKGSAERVHIYEQGNYLHPLSKVSGRYRRWPCRSQLLGVWAVAMRPGARCFVPAGMVPSIGIAEFLKYFNHLPFFPHQMYLRPLNFVWEATETRKETGFYPVSAPCITSSLMVGEDDKVWGPEFKVESLYLKTLRSPWKCMTEGWVKGDGMKTHCYYYYEEMVQYTATEMSPSRFLQAHSPSFAL